MRELPSKLVVRGILLVIAAACGIFVDVSISMGRMVESILRSFGLRVGHAPMSWDDYFFILVGAAATAALIGLILDRNWGNGAAVFAIAASLVWAGFMSFAPESWLETWFSTRIDRWPAAAVTALMIVALWRLSSRGVLSNFERSRVAK